MAIAACLSSLWSHPVLHEKNVTGEFRWASWSCADETKLHGELMWTKNAVFKIYTDYNMNRMEV